MAQRDQQKKSEAGPVRKAEPPPAPRPMEVLGPAMPVTAEFLERARKLSRRVHEPQPPAVPAPERMAEPVPAPPEMTFPSRPVIPQTFEQPEEEFVRPPTPTGHFFLTDVLLPELGFATLGTLRLVGDLRIPDVGQQEEECPCDKDSEAKAPEDWKPPKGVVDDIKFDGGWFIITSNKERFDEMPQQFTRYWDFEVEFWPSLDGKCCDEISIIQIVRSFKKESTDKDWKLKNIEDENKNRKPYQLPDSDGGWSIDIGKKETKNPFAGRKEDGSWDTTITTPGCKGRKKIKPLKFADWSSEFPVTATTGGRKEFVLCAVCHCGEEAGRIYGCIYYAYEFKDPEAEPGFTKPTEVKADTADPTLPNAPNLKAAWEKALKEFGEKTGWSWEKEKKACKGSGKDK